VLFFSLWQNCPSVIRRSSSDTRSKFQLTCMSCVNMRNSHDCRCDNGLIFFIRSDFLCCFKAKLKHSGTLRFCRLCRAEWYWCFERNSSNGWSLMRLVSASETDAVYGAFGRHRFTVHAPVRCHADGAQVIAARQHLGHQWITLKT